MGNRDSGTPPGSLDLMFPGTGEMASLMKAFDWSATPVGRPGTWPESLRTAIRICLTSSFPMWIWWGPEYTMFYNDAHRPMLGAAKHPHWLGRSAQGCWSEIWSDILPMLEGPLKRREASGFSDLLLILDRNRIKEETYFTFSISPILGTDGSVEGLICPTTETSRRVVSERRLGTLRDLGARAGETQSPTEACARAAEILRANPHDVAFALIYLLESDGRSARLAGSVGIEPESPSAPGTVTLERPESGWTWPLRDVALSRQARHLQDPPTPAPLPGGPWPEPCREVMILPIGTKSEDRLSGFLVAGASPRRVFDEDYRSFFDLVAGHLSTAVSGASAYEAQRRRAESLAAIDRAKTAFFSNVSHEFRTPLTLMLGPIEDELAERTSPLQGPRRERLEAAHRNTLRLLKLVNSLLDFSRIEAGRQQAAFEPVDLAAYTAELAGVFRSAFERAKLRLTVECPPLPEPVYVDREMWEKIVLNLLSNAFKHTFEGGVTVTLAWRDHSVLLAVSDTGVGIPRTERPRLFERFHRVKGSPSRTHEGTGIGLALVKELVGQHGGAVDVESEEGRGSTFTVTLRAGRDHLPPERIGRTDSIPSATPRAAAFVEEALHWLPEEAAPARQAAGEERLGPAGSPERAAKDRSKTGRPLILLADDNADMRNYLRRLLADRYEVLTVPDGKAALAAAQTRPPDLVLSDVMMPELDGVGLLRELRAGMTTRDVPVILLSARAGEESTIEGLAGGADDYIVKPFSARELLARVRTHLDLSRTRQAWARELEEMNKELGAFNHSVAHDLRAPLRVIDGFSRILQEDHSSHLDAEGRRVLGVILKNTRRMSDLIDSLLRLARLGQAKPLIAPFDSKMLVQEVLVELREGHPRRTIEASVGTLPPIWGDRSLLRQVFFNLLSNAIKYSAPREVSRIEVIGTTGPEEAIFHVKDNGVGFKMENAHRLFGIFQRLHSNDEFEGSGVGLALVHRIIRHHHGRVWAEGREGEGATFSFAIPAAEVRAGARR